MIENMLQSKVLSILILWKYYEFCIVCTCIRGYGTTNQALKDRTVSPTVNEEWTVILNDDENFNILIIKILSAWSRIVTI